MKYITVAASGGVTAAAVDRGMTGALSSAASAGAANTAKVEASRPAMAVRTHRWRIFGLTFRRVLMD
ncbi:hypothetical protein G6F21_014639 [Rhizopus arrhizus]|nr:hypothetical protein G6F21_014639 [Rhizopus arrhizus]KAG1218597.1 hypothetical protein G6F68_021552 [Rhizopus microsporus]